MHLFQDILETNREIIPKACRLLLKNWPILFTGIVYSIILIFLWRVASMFWILAGIVITLVQSAIISNYLYLIENIIRYQRITMEDFKAGFTAYIWKVYGIMIVIWFVNYGASLFLSPLLNIRLGTVSLWFLVKVAAFLLLNCLPEVIYQKHFYIGDTFRYSFEFIKENWIDWYIPNVILGLLCYIIIGDIRIPYLLLGNRMLAFASSKIFLYLAGQVLLAYFMIYRGLLFEILSGTSRRKRMFMRNQYR